MNLPSFWQLPLRRYLVFLLDNVFIVIAYLLAFLLRFDFRIPPDQLENFQDGFYVVFAVKPLVFVTSSLYRSLWRYASFPDAVEIFKTVSIASVLSAFGLLFFHLFDHFPRSVCILDWGLLFAMMASSRLVWRAYRETYVIPRSGADRRTSSRTLIVGAGDAGNLLLKEIRKHHGSPYHVVGFIDDDPDKHGMRLNGVPVLGATDRLKELIAGQGVEKVIIAMPSVNRKKIRAIIRSCEKANVRFKTLPGIGDLINGKVSVSHIKDVEIEDLLGRDQVMLDEAGISSYLADKKILVTGAGGSIGSEICRQVARYSPYKLILFDTAETPLYHIEKELAKAHPDMRIVPIIGDVRNRDRVHTVFDEFTPEVVFHAAAYKHVPMMEYNPVEAILNNVGGTRVLADSARQFGVANFVMVSTDKAVNPTNVMGASKRAAEVYVQALAGRSATKFTTVRFGNVLGSNGSVIPLFKEQIRSGGPVTVTHPEVFRYFMTIPEASQLVLQAGSIGGSGDIFVLDMGEPVRITELAEELIRLSGLVPYEDIDIAFTGLRPGEKLFEELLIEGEGIRLTTHDKIRVLAPVNVDAAVIAGELKQLLAAAANNDIDALMAALSRLVPEFAPVNHYSAAPPFAFKRIRTDLFPKSA
jgi:FlaA1/EpsC-like NDP-sugar epimerase